MSDTIEARSLLETELIFGVRKRERFAWSIAVGAIAVALVSVGTTLAILPLKETQAFLTIVDRDTGLAERVVQVEHASVEQADAVKQSLLYNYVMDRETYDAADNEARLMKVYRESDGPARQSLRDLWSGDAPNFPPTLYGDSGKVTIEVLNITQITESTAQVRFVKTLRRAGEDDRIGKFYATVTYAFVPSSASALELLWQNPFGFQVTDYRVTSEQMEGDQ